MAAITKIEFWKDVGFLEGAIEIPSLSAADPINPDLTIEPQYPVMPSKERFFSKLKLKEYYEELMEMSYIRLTYEFNTSVNGVTTKIFYGWVRDVSLESDGDLPVTVIDWHIDEWRTWKSSVSFGSGHVKRRPFKDLDTTPIQNYPVRFIESGSTEIETIDIFKHNTTPVWWVLISCNITLSGKTTLIMFTYPVFLTIAGNTKCYYRAVDSNNNQITICGTPIYEIYDGLLDEDIKTICGVTPEAINGVWLSPISPRYTGQSAPVSGTGSQNDPYVFQYTPQTTYFNGSLGMLPLYGNSAMTQVTKTFTPPITSDEENRYCLVSSDGVRILELPYGFTVDSVTVTLVKEPDGPYLEFSFKDLSYGNLEGMVTNYPLPMLPVNSNAYTSYVYSGKQDYDREMRTIQSNANAWKSSASGAGTGAMMGAFGPAGLAVGSIGGASGGLISYGVEMLYQNDEEQRIEDRLQANQPSSLILSSNSLLTIKRQYGFTIKNIKPDSYSASQINATRSQFGISVDELMSSCDTLIRTTSPTGYYNIQNLIVSGDVPVSAKRWIREKFKTGVRLI